MEQKYLIPTILTTLVIVILIIIGPSSAIDISMNNHDTQIKEHEVATFDAKMQINSNQRTEIYNITVKITNENNSETSTCIFDERGKVIECDKSFLGIKPLSSVNQTLGYGYGYGYDYGYQDNQDISYRIKWRAPYIDEDTNFTIQMLAQTSQGQFELEDVIIMNLKNDNNKKNYPYVINEMPISKTG